MTTLSANQIPGPPLCDSDWPGRPREHNCTYCWQNGGPGHSPTWLRRFARVEAEYKDETPIGTVRRTCNYWSCRRREHCGSAYKVKLFGCIGARCEAHNPDAINVRYWALIAQADAA